MNVKLTKICAQSDLSHDAVIRVYDAAGNGTETHEPSVIGWIPSAQLYFRDSDGHLLEFIALLDDIPDPTFTGPLSQWQSRPNKAMRETASSPMSS